MSIIGEQGFWQGLGGDGSCFEDALVISISAGKIEHFRVMTMAYKMIYQYANYCKLGNA